MIDRVAGFRQPFFDEARDAFVIFDEQYFHRRSAPRFRGSDSRGAAEFITRRGKAVNPVFPASRLPYCVVVVRRKK